MEHRVIVPRVGMKIMSVNLVEWKKNVGDFVHEREPLMIIDTGLAVIEFASLHSGFIKEIYIEKGRVAIGTLLATIEEE